MTRVPEQGELFDQRYVVGPQVGRGPHSVLVKARHVDLGRDVAIKFLTASQAEGKVRERFRREARLLAMVDHPNILTLLDFGWTHAETPFLVTEFVDGVTLSSVIESEGALDPARVVAITRQLLSGLSQAHAQGIVHRDLKPDNIMLVEGTGDHIKLLDFGIAKLTGPAARGPQWADLTLRGQMVGTPRYMAPEQLVGHPATPVTDLFSVGLILYEMLTGQRAFPGTTPEEIMAQLFDPEPVLAHDDQSVHPLLRETVRLATCKDPDGRMSTCDEFLGHLSGIRL